MKITRWWWKVVFQCEMMEMLGLQSYGQLIRTSALSDGSNTAFQLRWKLEESSQNERRYLMLNLEWFYPMLEMLVSGVDDKEWEGSRWWGVEIFQSYDWFHRIKSNHRDFGVAWGPRDEFWSEGQENSDFDHEDCETSNCTSAFDELCKCLGLIHTNVQIVLFFFCFFSYAPVN